MTAIASHRIDFNGFRWSEEKLNELLADQEVYLTVQAGAAFGLQPNGSWSASAVVNWARLRYSREEPVALLLLLVTAFFDGEGQRLLRGEACR